MWSTKKPNTSPVVGLELKDLLAEKKSIDVIRPLDSIADRPTTWLGSSMHVKGDITGTEDLLIDGAVEGLIELDEGNVTVGKTAKLTTDIHARDVIVHGYVKGNVSARGRIEIRKGGAVIGNLTTAQITIEQDADFKGSIEINRSATREIDENVYPRAASVGAGRV